MIINIQHIYVQELKVVEYPSNVRFLTGKTNAVDSVRPEKRINKCSAVAEMGDRLATIDMDRKLGAVPLLGGELGAHLTQCGLGRGLPLYQVAS